MRAMIIILTVLCLILGLGSCAISTNVGSVVGGYILLLIAAIFTIGLSIFDEVRSVKEEVKKLIPKEPPKTPPK